MQESIEHYIWTSTVEQLEAQHRNAELTLERAQALLHTPAGQQSTVDSALAAERALAAQIAGAEAQLRESEINLGYTEIRAPIDRSASLNALTTAGTNAGYPSEPRSLRPREQPYGNLRPHRDRHRHGRAGRGG